MKKILLTGSGGFIGRNLKEGLSGKYEIDAPCRRELDLLDEKKTLEYLRRNHFDIIVHCANTNGTRRTDTTPYQILDGNLRMFFHLEKGRKYYGKMYYFGSGAEYDPKHYLPDMPEEYFDTHVPKNCYALSKYIMAKYCERSSNIYELCLFGVYGKYEEWERRFISNAICRVLKGMDITIHQNVYFDYLWIDDLVKIVEWFLEHEPAQKRYNVCRGEKIDLYSLGEMVKKILKSDCGILVEKEGWKPEYTADNHRLLQEMGGYHFAGFEDSIAGLCEYYKKYLEVICG